MERKVKESKIAIYSLISNDFPRTMLSSTEICIMTFDRLSIHDDYKQFFAVDKYNLTCISELYPTSIYFTLLFFSVKTRGIISRRMWLIIVLPIHQFAIKYILLHAMQVYITVEEK